VTLEGREEVRRTNLISTNESAKESGGNELVAPVRFGILGDLEELGDL
jgi:hypothetical protein